jgi:transcriptional regulator with XRE-family HTH domain
MSNSIVDEMNELLHYGMPRRSGRYPWGSGEDPYQHGRDFLGRIEELKKQGWTETPENIKEAFGLTTGQYRIEKKIATNERRALNVARAKSLKADGLGETEIGKKMGVNESTVRSWLNAESEARMNKAQNTADFLKNRLKEVAEDGGMVDVGVGVERELNISKENLNTALYLLQREGYEVYSGRIPQATNPGQFTTQRVLCVPGTEHSKIYDFDKVHTVRDYITRDDGETFEKKFHYPESMDSSRLMVRYRDDVGPDGARGIDKDGIIELRRGVADLSLGNSHYSQVRILVDGNKYLKGMAVYSDDMPDGVDVIFNTNKDSSVAKMDVLKGIKKDPDNPFGSAIKDAEQGGQYWYDPTTGQRVSAKHPGAKLGLINKRADEGDWTDWQDALPSQFLAKQSLSMARKQLALDKTDRLAEFDEICSLNNPTIKKHYLEEFASNCDAAAVHLKAAALPGQKYHVIIPINSLKDNEVYAPRYKDGTKLALIRYPHAGIFEIPILTVNNKHEPARKLLDPSVIDAVGINSKNAEILSGADFDGDTVMCIPTHDKGGKVKIASRDRLEGLIDFDPKTAYPKQEGMKFMKDPVTGTDNTQKQMGVISNLITDMTLGGATDAELAAAVRHSMVVIDAGKHELNYKQSEIDNNIDALKQKYQRSIDADGNVKVGGASTILSRSKGQESVDKRKGSPKVNEKGKAWYDPNRPEGALIYETNPDAAYTVTKTNKRTGEVTTVTKTMKQRSTRMAETDDAMTLVSDARHPMELVYADYANSMKALANRARLEMVHTGKIQYSESANKTYAAEVSSLSSKLNTALLNAGRERAAQRKANVEVEAKIAADPTMKSGDIKKAKQMAISKYRGEVGSVTRSKRAIKITDREWEAIQAGAISENKLKQILNNADAKELRQRATPRATNTLSQAKINRIQAYNNSNYTIAEIADKMNLSTSVVAKYLKGVN